MKSRKVKATRKNTEIYELRKENSQLKNELIDMTNAWKSIKSQLHKLEEHYDSRRRNNNQDQQKKLED